MTNTTQTPTLDTASIADELDMIECWLDCAYDRQRYTDPGYALALEGVTRALVDEVRRMQPVVDAAQAFEATRIGGAAFDKEYRDLLAAVRELDKGSE